MCRRARVCCLLRSLISRLMCQTLALSQHHPAHLWRSSLSHRKRFISALFGKQNTCSKCELYTPYLGITIKLDFKNWSLIHPDPKIMNCT